MGMGDEGSTSAILTTLPSEIIEHQAQQRRLDAEPCPRCGGDRLRNDFTDPGRCHASTVSTSTTLTTLN